MDSVVVMIWNCGLWTYVQVEAEGGLSAVFGEVFEVFPVALKGMTQSTPSLGGY